MYRFISFVASLFAAGCAAIPPYTVDPVNDSGPRNVPPAQSYATTTTSPAVLYTCPMHPQVVQEQGGKRPICGMKLVPKL